jgi:UDP-N-acetylmuramate dehydrogenase
MDILNKVSLKNYTTIKIGGKSSKIYFPESLEDLDLLKTNISSKKTIILGNGSNIAFKDSGYENDIISLKHFKKPIRFIDECHINSMVGVSCARFAKFCFKNKIPGFEFIHGIPGSLGGAIAMNAGAFGDEIWNHIYSVSCVLFDGSIKIYRNNNIKKSYRYVDRSKIKMFLDVTFNIDKHLKFNKLLLSKYSIKRSKSQPIKQWSSGCIFKNPSANVAASSLIDSANLSKERVGGIYVSRKHCNYLINDGTGTCYDLEGLILFIRNKIKTKYNVTLDREICIY